MLSILHNGQEIVTIDDSGKTTNNITNDQVLAILVKYINGKNEEITKLAANILAQGRNAVDIATLTKQHIDQGILFPDSVCKDLCKINNIIQGLMLTMSNNNGTLSTINALAQRCDQASLTTAPLVKALEDVINGTE